MRRHFKGAWNALIGCLALTPAVAAHAQSGTQFFILAEIDDNFGDYNNTYTLPPFDNMNGTAFLTGVSLTAGGDIIMGPNPTNNNSGGTVTNNSGITQNVTYTESVAETLSLVDIPVSNSGISTASQTYLNLAPGASEPFDATLFNGLGLSVPSSYLDLFTGLNSVSMNYKTVTTSTLTGEDISANITTIQSIQIQGDYTYNVVPEASSMLELAALIVIGGLALRRQLRKQH